MRRMIKALLLSVAVLGLMASMAGAQAASSTEKVLFPIDETDFNPCTGEDVALTGVFQVVFHTTSDGQGGFHVAVEGNGKDVSGVGLTTGNSYRAVGGFWFESNTTAGAELVTDTSVFNVLSRGSDDNAVVTSVFHITVNPDGDVTAFIDEFSFVCTG